MEKRVKDVTLKIFEEYLNKIGYKIVGTNWKVIESVNKGITQFEVNNDYIAVRESALFPSEYMGSLRIYFKDVVLVYTYGEKGAWDMVTLLISSSGNSFASFYKK